MAVLKALDDDKRAELKDAVGKKDLPSEGDGGIISTMEKEVAASDKPSISISSPRFPTTQTEIDRIVSNELSGVRFSAPISYNPRLRTSYGQTKTIIKGSSIVSQTIEIGKQSRPGTAELIDTILHEEMEARIVRRAVKNPDSIWGAMDRAGEAGTHPYLLPIVSRFMKLKGWS